jgi:hypothetical protein
MHDDARTEDSGRSSSQYCPSVPCIGRAWHPASWRVVCKTTSPRGLRCMNWMDLVLPHTVHASDAERGGRLAGRRDGAHAVAAEAYGSGPSGAGGDGCPRCGRLEDLRRSRKDPGVNRAPAYRLPRRLAHTRATEHDTDFTLRVTVRTINETYIYIPPVLHAVLYPSY